jgi:hypothetical protein
MLKYHSIITAVSAMGDEMPVGDDCEKRLIPAYLRWCCEREAMSTSKDTIYWGQLAADFLYNLQATRLSKPNTPARGRRLVGYRNSPSPIIKSHPEIQ